MKIEKKRTEMALLGWPHFYAFFKLIYTNMQEYACSKFNFIIIVCIISLFVLQSNSFFRQIVPTRFQGSQELSEEQLVLTDVKQDPLLRLLKKNQVRIVDWNQYSVCQILLASYFMPNL